MNVIIFLQVHSHVKNKSIIARIRGGLGNQLFIYAMARRLALKNDVALSLDIVSGFKNDGYRRKYLLDNFNIKANIATPYDSFEAGFGKLRRRFRMKVEQFQKLNNRSYIIEEKRSFEPRILNLEIRKIVYIDGLWQSERYFKDIEHIIRQDLELICQPCDTGTLKMADKIQNVNSISLHGRSYCEVPAKDKNGSPEVSDYYSKAADLIAQHIDNPHFFCFSDNLEWLKKNLKIPFPLTYVSHNPTQEDDNTIKDFWLMTQCKHHIIAESTFSWWGAWLNKSPNKIIIAHRCAWQNPDYIPNSWITL